MRAQRTERDRLAHRYRQYKCECLAHPATTAVPRSTSGMPASTYAPASASASAALLHRKENIAPKAASIVPRLRQARSHAQLQAQAPAPARSQARKRTQRPPPRADATSRVNSRAIRSGSEPQSQRQLQPRHGANTYSSRLLVPTASSRRKHTASAARLAKAPTVAHRYQPTGSRRGSTSTSTSTITRGASALVSASALTQRRSAGVAHPRAGSWKD